jgi:glycosyltransferase involved in cell wall biosynthesis
MNIVFVLTQSLDSPSGLGRYGPIARELVKQGHQVQIITLHHAWDQLARKQFMDAGVNVHYVGQMHVRKEGNYKTYYSPGKLLWISFLAIIKLTMALFRSHAEIIHLGKPQPFNVIAARLARRGRPLYCDCDDYEAETNRFNGRWQKAIVRYFEDNIIHWVQGLTVNTQFTLNRFVSLGFPKAQMLYLPNGVERSRFSQPIDIIRLRNKWQLPVDAPIILYIGTMGKTSHPVDLLLDAFHLALPHIPHAYLLLVGSGEDFDALKDHADSLGLGKHAIFTGRIKPENVPAYYQVAAVSVDPIYDDLIAQARCPLKIVESLAAGTPVICGDVGDRSLLLGNGEAGVLVHPGDSVALAEAIVTLVKEPRLRDEKSAAAKAAREQWYWDQLVQSFTDLYSPTQQEGSH